MQRTVLSGMFLGLILFSVNGFAFASEADELRERAKALRREASNIAERGTDEAERLERESVELLEAAERIESEGHREEGRPGIDKEVRQLHERLRDLLAKEREMQDAKAPEHEMAEVREQISHVKRELHHIHGHHGERHAEFRAQVEKLENAVRRIHHMRVAAENLKIAEMHDLAHEVMKKAEAMERDVHEAKHQLAVEMDEAHVHHRGEVPEFVRDLREEIERLRGELRELSERFEKR